MQTKSVGRLATLLIAFSALSYSQTDLGPSYRFLPSKQIRVTNLRLQNASTNSATDVLSAALSTIFNDPQVCCGKDSALGEVVLSADSGSIEDLARALQGRHMLGDGLPIFVNSLFLQPASAKPQQILAPLLENKPLLIEWNSCFYVVQGAVFSERDYENGSREYMLRQLLLLDTRYTDRRAQVSFRADSNSWRDVQGILILNAATE